MWNRIILTYCLVEYNILYLILLSCHEYELIVLLLKARKVESDLQNLFVDFPLTHIIFSKINNIGIL